MRLLILSLLLALPAAAMDSGFPSPGGQYVLRVAPDEVKMSHWIDVPYLCDSSGAIVWSAEFPWSLSGHHWLSSEELELELRKYPGDRPPVRVQLQIFARTFRAWEPAMHSWSESARTLDSLNRFLEEAVKSQPDPEP